LIIIAHKESDYEDEFIVALLVEIYDIISTFNVKIVSMFA